MRCAEGVNMMNAFEYATAKAQDRIATADAHRNAYHVERGAKVVRFYLGAVDGLPRVEVDGAGPDAIVPAGAVGVARALAAGKDNSLLRASLALALRRG